MRSTALFLVLAASIATPALSAEAPKLPRGDDVFRLGMPRSEAKLALMGAGMKILKQEGEFILCEGRDPHVEYEQYNFYALAHAEGVLWQVTFGFRADTDPAEFGRVDSELRQLLGAPTDTLDAKGGDAFNPVPERRLRWVDNRTLVTLAGRWPKEPQPGDRMIVEWVDLKYRRAIGGAANRPRAN